MKKIFSIIIIILLFISCEKPSECFESTGEIVTRDYPVVGFMPTDSIKRITVNRGIELVITEGPIFKVSIKSGSNLIDNIEVLKVGTNLILNDNTKCNWLRQYGQTIVYVTTPKLEEIYSKTDRNISSNGVLTFPTLKLFALDENGDFTPGAGTGDFFVTVNNSELNVETNNVARFYLSGFVTTASFNFYAGDSRIEAPNLTVQNIAVYHRGSNDMILKPMLSISGKMVSTGNIILKNNPPIVTVQELYQGHVIYN